MAIVLGLLAALSFGTGDLLAGLASFRLRAAVVCTVMQILALAGAIVAVLLFPGDSPTASVLIWGGIAGLAAGAAALCLYHGMTVGRISVVITLAGLVGAVIPVFVGVGEGDALSLASAIGVAIALPAIGLVSWHPSSSERGRKAGTLWGVSAGLASSVFFISLDHAGTSSGAWPIVCLELTACAVTAPLAAAALMKGGVEFTRLSALRAIGAGLLICLGNITLLAATGVGELPIVVVLTSLYPGVTVILARIFLAEHWINTQKLGLILAFAAVLLVSAGTS